LKLLTLSSFLESNDRMNANFMDWKNNLVQNKKVREKCLVNQTLYLILQSDLNKTLKHVKL